MYLDKGAHISPKREVEVSKAQDSVSAQVASPGTPSATTAEKSSSDAVLIELKTGDAQKPREETSPGRAKTVSAKRDYLHPEKRELPEVIVKRPDAAKDLEAALQIERPAVFELSSPAEILATLEHQQEGDEVSKAFREAVLKAYRSS